ncbi:hypothetical protein ABT336_04505 [Micromonospora sp. NPDC000207]|uniref:hypothetical protein n=1 Tax=Micromonospora sp. NPDC000207 TaxID=3154246 RepID=UPI0033335803
MAVDNGDDRTIVVTLRGVGPDQYADIANAIWMQLTAVGCDFGVTPDDGQAAAEIDERWDGYSNVSWRSGGRRGTPQFQAARKTQPGNPDRTADSVEGV